jgi:hypothetical protein
VSSLSDVVPLVAANLTRAKELAEAADRGIVQLLDACVLSNAGSAVYRTCILVCPIVEGRPTAMKEKPRF